MLRPAKCSPGGDWVCVRGGRFENESDGDVSECKFSRVAMAGVTAVDAVVVCDGDGSERCWPLWPTETRGKFCPFAPALFQR